MKVRNNPIFGKPDRSLLKPDLSSLKIRSDWLDKGQGSKRCMKEGSEYLANVPQFMLWESP